MTRAEKTTGSTRHSAGAVRSCRTVAETISRDQIVVASCIVVVTLLAWAYLFRLDRGMDMTAGASAVMSRMALTIDAPWSAREFFFTFAMWSVMMTGMMTVTAAPVLLLFTKMRSAAVDGRPTASGLLFGVGHILVWIGFSALSALAQWTLHQNRWLSSGMVVTSSRVGGLILVAAGAYQLTPGKSKCLKQCQSPLGFLLSNWRDGARGAFELGLRHGAFCLGCCWAIMLVLFVVGVMNLVWVALLTAFVLVEKFGPSGVRLARIGGVVMIAFGAVNFVT